MSQLPYAWAKAQRALLRPGEHGATQLVSPRTPGWAISEVRQRHAGAPRGWGRPDERSTLQARGDTRNG
ncbi:type II secretion system protein GspE, partial [Pseudomonas aeruginosa]